MEQIEHQQSLEGEQRVLLSEVVNFEKMKQVFGKLEDADKKKISELLRELSTILERNGIEGAA